MTQIIKQFLIPFLSVTGFLFGVSYSTELISSADTFSVILGFGMLFGLFYCIYYFITKQEWIKRWIEKK